MEHWISQPIELTGKAYGYARVSVGAQDLTEQRAALLSAGVPDEMIVAETVSSSVDRLELTQLMLRLRPGDILHVTRVDRLVRYMRDFARIAHDLKRRGIGLRVVQQGIDTTQGGVVGANTLRLLEAFAQFEWASRRERQMEGIEKAKQAGKYKGRKPLSINPREVNNLRARGLHPCTIASQLNISRASVYRLLKKATQ